MRYIAIILFLFNVASAQSLFGVVAGDGTRDADAQFFIDTVGVSDATQKYAINYLCRALKGAGLWSKMTAIYPVITGTSTGCAFNLKNPRSNNLTFLNSPTFSANGIQWNGTNSYATGLPNPSNLNSSHLSYYTRTNNTSPANQVPLGSSDPASSRFFQLNIVAANGAIGDVGTVASFTNTDTRGFYVVSRTSSTNIFVNKNGTDVATNTGTNSSTAMTTTPILGARSDNGTIVLFSAHQCAFASVGTGLTSSEATTFYNIVQFFQTILGRQN